MPFQRMLLVSMAPKKNCHTNFQWPTQKEIMLAVLRIATAALNWSFLFVRRRMSYTVFASAAVPKKKQRMTQIWRKHGGFPSHRHFGC